MGKQAPFGPAYTTEAEGFAIPNPEGRKGKSLKQEDKVAMLAGGPSWHNHLSEYFCHDEVNWRGPSWQDGVTSMDTIYGLACAEMVGTWRCRCPP